MLSETDIKQILGGVRSQSTLEYFSKYMGEYSAVSSNFSLSQGGVQESVSRTNRRLSSEDELRRLPDGAQIIFYGNLKPILARKVQVFSIAPWRLQIGVNSLYGGKRKLLPVEVRIGWLGTKVTAIGRRAYRKMLKEMARPASSGLWRVLGQLGAKWNSTFTPLLADRWVHRADRLAEPPVGVCLPRVRPQCAQGLRPGVATPDPPAQGSSMRTTAR